MNFRYKLLIMTGLLILGLFLFNASFLAPRPDGSLTLMSHRGVHQPFHRGGVENDTCTAQRILHPTHGYLENTLPSMRAALGYGADMIELDIHPTTDGEFAVFHDWTLDCRTNGKGKVRDQSSVYLKSLDIGHGYTADDGQNFPFRGQFVGGMPMLNEAMTAFPHTRFLIDIKGRSKTEAQLLVNYLEEHNIPLERIVIYGHQKPISRIEELKPEITTFSTRSVKDCLKKYVALGWSGHIPESCRNTWVIVPENYRWLVWGWPNRFQERLSDVRSEAVLVGPHSSARSNPAIDTEEQIKSIPANFSGTVWTDRIEVIGPALSRSAK